MNILCIGISHHTAAVGQRERTSLSGEALCNALSLFALRAEDFAPLSEAAILSTCSRFEMYAVDPEAPLAEPVRPETFAPLFRYLEAVFGVKSSELEPYAYRYSGEEAVRHLCRVAASLDSMVLGEPQVLGQVSAAHHAALDQGSARHVLSSLFRTAVHAGKRVRTETTIARHPTNMSAVAIHLAEGVLGPVAEQRVLVTGTGEIGQQSLKALYDYGARHLAIASRSLDRATLVGEEYDARPVQIDQLEDALGDMDVVLASTTTTKPLIDAPLAERLLARRSNRPLVLVDLAVPRNIDPAVRKVPGAAVFDLDDVQAFIDASRTSRQNEIPRAEAIVAEETASFLRWLAVIPVVGELHRRAETIRKQEVQRALHHLQDADPQVVDQLERLSQSLVRKLLHEPTSRLRHAADHDHLEEYIEAINALYHLQGK